MKITCNGNFQEKVFGNLGIRPREVALYKFWAFFYSAPSSFGLDLRTSCTRMTVARIRKWINVCNLEYCLLSVDRY